MTYKIRAPLSEDDLIKRILYRDALILVINKPSGLPVHKAGGGKHNLEQYFHHLQFGLPQKPALAHRLDLGTSGCLVLARHTYAAQRMNELFGRGEIKKTYMALVHGVVKEDEGQIDIPLKKQSSLKKHWWMKADENGPLKASTRFKVASRSETHTLLKLSPLTGRTHQLRVHCQHMGHPIVGDYIYGLESDKKAGQTLCLHAQSIVIPLYKKKPPIVVTAPEPAHITTGF